MPVSLHAVLILMEDWGPKIKATKHTTTVTVE